MIAPNQILGGTVALMLNLVIEAILKNGMPKISPGRIKRMKRNLLIPILPILTKVNGKIYGTKPL